MKRYYLAVDIGASSGRHILGCVEDGKIVLEEVYRFPNGMVEKNGRKCWDHESLVANVIEGMKKCREIGKIPVCMGIDTWGVDFALLDKNGDLIGDIVGYRDNRTDGMDALVEGIVSPSELYERTGIQKQIFNTVYQMMSVKKQTPEELERAETLLMMPDYLNYRLTGEKHQEYTNATTSGLVNVESGEWDTALIQTLGYPKKLFGSLSMPGETVGKLLPEIAAEIGYDLTVLHAPSHDTASAVLAVPIKSKKAAYISSGTWSLLGTEKTEATVTDVARGYNFTNEGGYEKRYRFLKNIMGLWIIQSIKKEAGKYSFAELCDMARGVGDTDLRINVNDKAFLAPKSMIDAIRAYCKCPDLPLDELLCCVYHSLAESYAQSIKELTDCTGVSPDALHIVGGGSQDDYLNELTAEACGIPVCTGPTEATAIGNLLCSMLAYGEFSNVEEAREAVAKSFDIQTINPKGENKSMNHEYQLAKEKYAALGIDTEAVLNTLAGVPISLHCWQGDDVRGFDSDGALDGGIQTTGNYMGRARTPEELMQDIDLVLKLDGGAHKLNLHACYAIFDENNRVDRDELRPEHFAKWVEFAKARGMGIDFNPTFFSHPKAKGLTLSSPDEEIRSFWVRHGIACLKISEYFAKETGIPCVMNVWIPDGYKDIPADRIGPRARFMKSMDEILSTPYDKNLVHVTLESKVFGIGLESYTVGSAEFGMGYVLSRGIVPLMDNGHYHPTEMVSDKISSMLLFSKKLALHVTRAVRWDSDHVVRLDDETKEIAKEIVASGRIDDIFIALDYFDASINRIAAWTTGLRNFRKALLIAMLTPHARFKEMQNAGELTELFVLQEELKGYPWGAVYEEYCRRTHVPTGNEWFEQVKVYEQAVLANRI